MPDPICGTQLNIRPGVPLLGRILTDLSGTYGRFASSRLLKRFLIDDPEKFLESVERLYAWPIERIIMTHGEISSGDPDDLRAASADYA